MMSLRDFLTQHPVDRARVDAHKQRMLRSIAETEDDMNPHDEMRALTCHCGRIACRHHERDTPMKIVKQTTYNLGALTVNDLIAHLEIIQETAGECEIIKVESEYEWDEDLRTGERRNKYGAVYVTVQEKA